MHHLFGKKREDTVFNQLFCSLIYTYTCVQNTYSTERQKREINAGEGKNHRVKGRWKEGVKEERAAYRSPFALAEARQVQHRGQLPSLSWSKLPRPRVARQRPGATRCLLRQTCFGKKERRRREQTGRGFSILSPHLPNSALIPSHCIRAVDFHLASRGTLLLAT